MTKIPLILPPWQSDFAWGTCWQFVISNAFCVMFVPHYDMSRPSRLLEFSCPECFAFIPWFDCTVYLSKESKIKQNPWKWKSLDKRDGGWVTSLGPVSLCEPWESLCSHSSCTDVGCTDVFRSEWHRGTFHLVFTKLDVCLSLEDHVIQRCQFFKLFLAVQRKTWKEILI